MMNIVYINESNGIEISNGYSLMSFLVTDSISGTTQKYTFTIMITQNMMVEIGII